MDKLYYPSDQDSYVVVYPDGVLDHLIDLKHTLVEDDPDPAPEPPANPMRTK